MAEHDLLDRAADVAAVDAVIAAASNGVGGMLVVDGPAGLGKTALLKVAVDRAATAAARVLSARGSELEQGFPAGVVRQLFGTSLVAPRDGGQSGGTDLPAMLAVLHGSVTDREFSAAGVGFAVLQELYWMLVELSDAAPVVVLIDDARWADELSLRFLRFLGARLQDLPVAVIVACRPGWTGSDSLATDPAVRMIRLSPLGRDSVASWLESELQQVPGAAFVDAVAQVTGGNPLLVREVIRELAAERIGPDDARAARVESLSPRGVATAVLLRLAGASEAAWALVRTAAVLEVCDVSLAAALADLSDASARAAAAELARRGVLAGEQPLRFAHPLLRTAVYEQLSSEDRAAGHARAAQLLLAGGEAAERIAPHVLLAPPPTHWAVATLRAAASQAAATGLASVAATYLHRAADDVAADARGPDAAEAADTDLFAQILIELGRVSAAFDAAAAIEQLTRAAAAAAHLPTRVRAAIELSRVQRVIGQGSAAVDTLLAVQPLRSSADPGDDRLAEQVNMELLACSAISITARRRLTGWRARVTADRSVPADAGGWERMVAATAALDGALDGEPRRVVAAHAAGALAGLHSAVARPLEGVVMSLVGLAQLLIDDLDQAERIFTALVEQTRDPGYADRQAAMLAQRASLWLRTGQLSGARAEAERALALGAATGTNRNLLPRAAAVLLSVAAQQGTDPPLALLVDDIEPDSIAVRLLAYSRAELLLARGEPAAAAQAFDRYGRLNLELGWRGVASPWRSQLALALRASDTAVPTGRLAELVEAELDVARRSQVARAVGIALRAHGLLAHGASRTELLVEAANVLDAAATRLERAWTLADLGRAQLADGRGRDARTALATAHEIATACGATRLADRAAADLLAAGARPRRPATGAAALTPAERTVAQHAAAGLSNRKIAQTLFVTEKTVETHLHSVFHKLGVTSRRDLPSRLADTGSPAG